MYRLVALDLDGTLLNSYGEISSETREAIKQSVEKGVEIVLASGRPISSVEDLANELQANHYIVSNLPLPPSQVLRLKAYVTIPHVSLLKQSWGFMKYNSA